MKILDNMKLSSLLGTAFGALVLIAAVISAIGAVSLNSLTTQIDDLAQRRLQNLVRVGQVKDNVNEVVLLLRDLQEMAEPAHKTAPLARIRALQQDNQALLQTLQANLRTVRGKALVADIMDRRGAFLEATGKVLALAVNDPQGIARQVLAREVTPLQVRYFSALNAFYDFQHAATVASAQGANQSTLAIQKTLVTLGVLGLAVGALLSWRITARVRHQLGGEPGYAAQMARQVSRGDLSTAVQLRQGDGSSLLAAMEAMRQSLAEMVRKVRESSESIATGARQIAAGNADLNQRTEAQAANLQQTAASMEQMNATVRQSSDTVRTAGDLAASASALATDGGVLMTDVVATMGGISSSSRRIGDIIGLIDSIAFQTNILALNAAVEAARAGEQGRGFAVVAAEVRMLAQRSADAARQIKTLITESITTVEAGSALVDQAGASMSEIVARVRRVAGLLQEMGAATVQQQQGISQVSAAVSQLDHVTQQNASLVEQSAAAAGSLHVQAHTLVGMVRAFTLPAH